MDSYAPRELTEELEESMSSQRGPKLEGVSGANEMSRNWHTRFSRLLYAII